VLRSIFWFASQGKSKLKFTSLEEIALEIFNYLNVMIAILLGVGLFQIFGGIGRLLQIRHRVKPYWLHSLWVLILIMAHAHLWWSFWGLRDAVRWNYVEFLYLLIGPAGLVIISQVIIPGELYGELHDQKFDLRRHYYDISHLFFSIFSAVMSWAIFLEPVLGVRSSICRIPNLASSCVGRYRSLCRF